VLITRARVEFFGALGEQVLQPVSGCLVPHVEFGATWLERYLLGIMDKYDDMPPTFECTERGTYVVLHKATPSALVGFGKAVRIWHIHLHVMHVSYPFLGKFPISNYTSLAEEV